MSTTHSARLTADHGHRPRLYFTIQGVPNVFQEDETDVPSTLETSTRPRTKLIDKIEISPSKLNIARRRMEGGTLTITLIDDDDRTLATLFQSRSRRKAYLTQDHTTSVGTITQSRTTGLTSPVYVDAETITFTGTTSTTLTGAGRGAFGSTAQAHLGSSTTGSEVFQFPPNWKGRRITLKSYFLNDDGTTTSALSRTEGVYSIEKAPKLNKDGTWTITCSTLADEFFGKKIGVGIRDIEINARLREAAAGLARADVNVGAGAAMNAFVVGGVDTYVLFRLTDDTFSCKRLHSQETSTTIRVDLAERALPQGEFSELIAEMGPGVPVTRARHIAILEGAPGVLALQILTSRLGDATNGSRDVLPGFDAPDEGEPSWRFGAGIASSDISTSSFTSGDLPDDHMTFVIDEEMTVEDFLFDFCLATNTFAYVTRAGLLAVKQMANTSNTSSMTIDDDMIAGDEEPEIFADEESIYPSIQMLCNYDPLSREYCGEAVMNDGRLRARYPQNDQVLQLSSKSIVISEKPLGKVKTSEGQVQEISRRSISVDELQNKMRRIQMATGRPDGYVKMRCHLPVLDLDLGDLVELTVEVPDLEGETSMTAKLCRVVELGPRWDDAEVDVTLQLLERRFVVAVGCRIASVDGSGTILTLTTGSGNIESNSTSQPGFDFAVDWPVRIYDVDAGTVKQRIITVVSGTTIRVDSAIGFAIEANVDFVIVDDQSAADATENLFGFDGNDLLYQMRDDEYASGLTITRWS